MRKSYYLIIVLLCSFLFLTACSRFFEKDNLPQPSSLVSFKPEIKPHLVFKAKPWISVNDEHLELTPAINHDAILTASSEGYVTSTNQLTGRVNWRKKTRLPLTAGPGAGNGMVVVASRYGEVLALDEQDGKMLWKTNVHGEILANPAMSSQLVVIKTTDGAVYGLDNLDGTIHWQFQQAEPNLILRGSSSPLIEDQRVIAGFANGNLAKLKLNNGQLQWLQPVATPEGAFSIQRMIDIDADPIVYQHHIYAATYQGKIAALDWNTGKIRWTQHLSSYTGMVAEDETIYISDADSVLWAFNAKNGEVKWKQTKLRSRRITAPAILGNYVAVADAYGYLHWLDKHDGHFVARANLKSPVLSPPLTNNNKIYIQTNKGRLYAYSLT